ncbi:MAG: GGDEF domain-containing protein [Rhodospirillaceae bacterium]|jgi:diguanylate cyclase (GGDEF)-like protein|nr:GGDEF domain-containing protein [Rhodospirillaceae bacterium]MBT4686653.1 GGDEF domain-containing protein [Rhodospirillaceae bacterium]MBT5082239.1 GGDEF domain-containing protein [Rhodospirillaceae bacterium]MBT5526758.1 GGDEF domain-containing protein [Rhodospirillaceae bacterium]MBT5879123.1 GGDEF domain-containing protein [Rhodospirillaceae bacterium]
MKIPEIRSTGTTRTAAPQRRNPAAAAASYASSSDLGVAATQDSASVMGIPEPELTPKVRQAIMTLMQEVEGLRTEMERVNSRLAHMERLADQDTLVPVPNRRAFVREMSRVISYNQRYDAVSSLVYFDLNDFKQINDKYGHAAGDATLMHVAAALTENLRESDMLGRLGGDEFGVILSHTDAAQALEKGRQLAHAIMAKPVDYEGAKITVTASYGITTFKPGDSAQEAMEAADRAMYEQKNALKSAVKPTPKPGANPGDKPGTG